MGNFGRRTLHHELLKEGCGISEYKISKILKAAGLSSKYGRKKCHNVHTSKIVAERYIAENLYPKLGSEDRSREIWSMDFTEEKVAGRTVISCGIVSVNGKQLVARLSGCRNNKDAACHTLRQGIQRFGKPYMLMTDRGSPFISKAFHDELVALGIRHSMSRPHTPVDNRFIETFWKSMKTEIGKVKHLSVESYLFILDYYEHYYNYLRPHSSLGYSTPL
jgi:putative transposase